MTVESASRPRRLIFEMAKRPDLQGMRAVAVLAVFADHLFGWPSGGFVGVDIFFVLSGFFITGLLLKERSHEGTVSFGNFYTRRVKRIIPSALLVLVVTVVAANYLFPAERAKDTLIDALWAALFGANIHFQMEGADYFQQGLPPSPIQHYWSLSIEEQFYFVWPIILVGLFLVTRKLYRRGHVWARHGGLFGAMSGVVAASFTWAMIQSTTDPNAAYFSTFTRVWELGVGALVAIAGPWLSRIPSTARPTLAYLGLAGVIGSLFVINAEVQFPAPWAALPVLSTALVIASFYGDNVRAVPLLTNPIAKWFGDTSYTLYLWHWPVIILLSAAFPEGPMFYVLALTLALGLTGLTYHFYENPIRHSHWLSDDRNLKWFLRGQVWAFTGVLAVALIAISLLGIRQADMISVAQNSSSAEVDRAQAVNLQVEADPCFGAVAMVNEGCNLRDAGTRLTPSVDNLSQDTGGVYECYRKKESDEPTLKACEYGYKGVDAVRIALVGDSHAASILPALGPALIKNRWHLTTYLGQSCNLSHDVSSVCKGPVEQVITDLVANPYDLVITTSLIGSQKPESYSTTWRPIVAAGNRMAVIADNPTSSEEAFSCVTRVNIGDDKTGECGTPRDISVRPDPLVAAAQSAPGTTVIDLTRFYCRDDRCPSVIGDVIVYRDYVDGNSHITATFAQTLSEAVEEGIRAALADPKP